VTVEFLEPEVAAQAESAALQPPSASPSPRDRVPRSYLPQTLTGRIATGVVVLVILVVTGIGFGTSLALRSFLEQRLDQQLQTTARGAGFLFSQRGSLNGPRPANVWAVALDPDTGQVLSYPTGQNLVAMRLSAAQRASIAARRSTDPVTVVTTDGT
jgi:hypothetical protein